MQRGLKLALTAAALIALLQIPGVQAGDNARQAATKGVDGKFNLQAMMHTSTEQFPDLRGVNSWDGRKKTGNERFVYRSIPCRGNAPVNNISSNLPSYNARVAQSRVPSSTRLHPFRFKVKQTKQGPRMVGRIKLTVCQLRPGPTPDPDPVADADKPKIVIGFRAKFDRENVEDVRFDGRFRIIRGTRRYDDLRGSGTIAGYLFCFAPDGCAGSGRKFRDGQISLQGSYRDPTPELAAG